MSTTDKIAIGVAALVACIAWYAVVSLPNGITFGALAATLVYLVATDLVLRNHRRNKP